MGVGQIVFSAILPHPPALIPKIGKENSMKFKTTRDALIKIGEKLNKLAPDTIIFISAPQNDNTAAIGLYSAPKLEGDLSYFNAPDIKFEFENDFILGNYLVTLCKHIGLNVLIVDKYKNLPLNYTITTPLYFLAPYLSNNTMLLPIVTSKLPVPIHYQFGQAISKSIEASGQRVAIISTANLSNNLNENNDEATKGKQFDNLVVQAIKNGDISKFFNIPSELISTEQEFEYKSIMTLLGVFAEIKANFEVLSYEAPLGVGHLVATILPEKNYKRTVPRTSFTDIPLSKTKITVNSLVELAKKTVETFVKSNEIVNLNEFCLKEFKNKRNGVFVTIEKNNELVGCIGTIRCTLENVVEETIYNTLSTITKDKKTVIKKEDIPHLRYKISIINKPEHITDISDLDPKLYGLIANTGYTQAVLLPNLPDINTVEEQLNELAIKANILPGERVWLYKFTVNEFKESKTTGQLK